MAEKTISVEVDNQVQLAAAMLKLARDSELRKKMGQEGYEWVRKHFDSERLVAEHIALYERIYKSLD